MSIFVKIEGIEGDATAEGFEKQIQVEDFEFDARYKASGTPGGRKADSGGGHEFCEVSFNKLPDPSTTELMIRFMDGEIIPELVMVETQRKKKKNMKVRRYTFHNVLLKRVQSKLSGDALSLDHFTFSWAKFDWEFFKKGDKEEVDKVGSVDASKIA